jgi:hypothetical protein
MLRSWHVKEKKEEVIKEGSFEGEGRAMPNINVSQARDQHDLGRGFHVGIRPGTADFTLAFGLGPRFSRSHPVWGRIQIPQGPHWMF